MSAQGAILATRGMHLPVWPVIATLVAAVALGIGVRMIDEARRSDPAVSVAQAEGFWNPTVGHPVGPRMGAVAPVLDAAAIEASAAAVRELPARPFHADGRAHEVVFGVEAVGVTSSTQAVDVTGPHPRPKYPEGAATTGAPGGQHPRPKFGY